MKILVTLVCLLAAGITPAAAQNSGAAGAGVILGDPTGITGKFWLNNGRALDVGLGLNDNVTIYGDYLWHSWRVFPQPSEGKLPAYLGLGAQIGNTSHHDSSLGLRAVAGLAYWLPHDPVEIFLELVPVLNLSHDTGLHLNAGLGVRYYFKAN